jgi:RNA polymerase sigma-70 factor (ECF subfamily)
VTEERPEQQPGPTPDITGIDADKLRAELVEAAPAVRRFLFGLCGDWHRSEDLSQEALLKAWRKRETFDGRSALRTWVFTIARNHWLSSLRTLARRPREEPVNESTHLDSQIGPVSSASRGELAEAVARALARLPDDQREVLALRESAGLTFAEAAAVLGVPVGTAKSRARYALVRLAQELEPFRQELES